MIVVTEIKTLKTDRDVHQLHRAMAMTGYIGNPRSYDEAQITTEMIEGRRFVNPKTGEDIIIGWSEDVQKLLGFPFEVIESQSKLISEQLNKVSSLSDEIRAYRIMMNEANDIITRYENMSMLNFIGYRLYKYLKQFIALISG